MLRPGLAAESIAASTPLSYHILPRQFFWQTKKAIQVHQKFCEPFRSHQAVMVKESAAGVLA
jgi:hypothetical protein